MSAKRRTPPAARPGPETGSATATRPRTAAGRTLPGGPTDRRAWLYAAGIFCAGVAAYANTLGHGFVWDDPIWLEQKIRFYRGPLDAFFEPTWMPMRQVYRPLSQVTYWLDQSLWWRNAAGFHATSVLLHALNGVLLFWLARALAFTLPSAAAAAALFLVHPIQPESVAWITNRVDVLATVFVLVAVIAALRPPSPFPLAAVALAAVGAAASKETGCVVPLLVAATALLDRRLPATPPRRPWLAAAVSAAAIVPYFMLRPTEAGTGIPLATLGLGAIPKLVGSLGYQYERLIAPIGFRPYFAHVPTDALTFAWAAVGTLLAAAGLLLRDRTGRRRFAVVWILVGAALPVAVVLADFSSTPVAEHRLYLTVVGVALLLATGLDAWNVATRAKTALVGVALLAVALVTVDRNRSWRDDLTLWSAVTDRIQTEPVPYLNLGLGLTDAGRRDEAEAAYRRGLALDPKDTTRQRIDINLGLLVLERGALDDAQKLFDEAIALGPHAIAHRGLAMIARRRAQSAAASGDQATAAAQLGRAKAELDRALAINPRYHQAHFTLAGVLYDAGRYRAALAEYQRVIELAGDTDTGRNAAAAAQELGAWLATHPDAP